MSCPRADAGLIRIASPPLQTERRCRRSQVCIVAVLENGLATGVERHPVSIPKCNNANLTPTTDRRPMSDKFFDKLIGSIGSVAWNERRFARRASLELLDVFWQEKRAHPELSGKDLYVRVAARRTQCDEHAAQAIVRQAEESFADWPVGRDVTLRDVVAYLVISTYLESNPGHHGTHTNIRNVVVRMIPGDL